MTLVDFDLPWFPNSNHWYTLLASLNNVYNVDTLNYYSGPGYIYVSNLRPVIQVIFSSSFQVEERKEGEDEEEEKIHKPDKSKDGKCRKQIQEMCADIKNKLEYSEGGKI